MDRTKWYCSSRRLPSYPLPVLRLARLGVDTRAQGLGIGKALLRHVLGLAIEQRDRLGCVGVVTDAKSEAVHFYEGLGFVALEGVREGMLAGEPLPMFLGIETIAATLAGPVLVLKDSIRLPGSRLYSQLVYGYYPHLKKQHTPHLISFIKTHTVK